MNPVTAREERKEGKCQNGVSGIKSSEVEVPGVKDR